MNPLRFSLEHLFALRTLTGRVPMAVSPDGGLLAVSVQGPHEEALQLGACFTADGISDELLGSRVLVVTTDTGACREPFPAGSASWAGRWSPDGRRLAAYVRHEGHLCLAVWERHSGEQRLLRDAPVRPSVGFELPRWTPDGERIVIKRHPLERPRAGPESSVAGRGVVVMAHDPAETGAGTDIAEYRVEDWGDLAVVDLATGRCTSLAQDWNFNAWRVSPDGRNVAVPRRNRYEQVSGQIYFDLEVVPLDGSAARTIARGIPMLWGLTFSWSPDSRQLAWFTNEQTAASRLFVAPADGAGEPRQIKTPADLRVGEYRPPMWSRDGSWLLVLADNVIWSCAADGGGHRKIQPPVDPGMELFWPHGPYDDHAVLHEDDHLTLMFEDLSKGRMGLVSVAQDGGHTTVLEGPAADVVRDPAAAADRSAFYFCLDAAASPPAIWKVEPQTRQVRRLAGLGPSLDTVDLGEARLVEWLAPNGKRCGGVLWLPPDHREGERLPLIVEVYAGTTNAVSRIGRLSPSILINPYLLTARGFAVLFPDLPLEEGDPMRQIPALVWAAVNRVVEMGIADPQRLGVMGQSYGGYTVLSILVQSSLFKAAACNAAIGNWVRAYGNGSIRLCESGQARLHGSPWEKREAYIENSPFFYLDRVTTPLLITCGGEDSPDDARETFYALRRLGKQAELRLYPGESHGPTAWSQSHQRDLYQRIMEWFDLHLGGGRDIGE